jgi:hypothetical protein
VAQDKAAQYEKEINCEVASGNQSADQVGGHMICDHCKCRNPAQTIQHDEPLSVHRLLSGISLLGFAQIQTLVTAELPHLHLFGHLFKKNTLAIK